MFCMLDEYYVYILRCNDGSYYTGVTNDYEKRFSEHQDGLDSGCYTFKRRPLELVYHAEFSEITDAIALEKRVKRWSRKKKEALIRRDQVNLERNAWSMYRKRIEQMAMFVNKKAESVMVSPTNHDGQGVSPFVGLRVTKNTFK